MSITIFLFGTLIALLIWFVQHKKWLGVVILLLVTAIGILAHLGIESGLIELSAPNDDASWYDRSPYFEIIAFLCMMLGMAVRYVTNAIEERRKKIVELKKEGKKSKKKPKLEFDVWEFSYPLFFSVITFGLLLKQFEIQMLSVSNVILSFQTGFFWQTLLKKNLN